jgi:hypothetical protein
MAAQPSPVTPSVLRWAVDEDGRNHEDLAHSLHVDVDVLDAWLEGEAAPTRGLLIDPTDEDPAGAADPYVAGMACEIQSANPGCRVVVATDDRVDRLPNKIALTTACDRLHIDHWSSEAFVAWAYVAPDDPEFEVQDPPDDGPE